MGVDDEDSGGIALALALATRSLTRRERQGVTLVN